MIRTSRLIAVTAALTLSSVAASVQVAQGATRTNDRVLHGVGAVPDAFERAVIRAGVSGTPDVFERAVLRAQAVSGVRPDDRGQARGPGSVAATSLPSPAAESGFAWDYAMVGAAGALGLCLVAGLGLARQHRRLATR